MLTMLRIKNLALVADLTLELQPGYNAITGETGTGKSVMIGALTLLLGQRADRTLIRNGEESCTVEAVFDIRNLRAPLAAFLDENGLEPCEDKQLVIKRVFTAAGSNRQFVNGTPTTLGILGSLGEWLVDIHGPHDHQSLFNAARQLDILDAYGSLGEVRQAFAERVGRRNALLAEKAALIVDEKTYAQQLDLLRFQVHEIRSANLDPAEEEQLTLDHQRASNSARLLELGQTAQGILSEADESILTQMGALGRALQELERIDAGAESLAAMQAQAVEQLHELQTGLSHYLDRVDLDPQTLQQLDERMNLVQTLKRKYGSSLAEVIAFGEEAAARLASLEQRDAELERIQADMAKTEQEMMRCGKELSAQRRKVIPRLCKAVEKELAALGFKQSHFDVTLESATRLTDAHSSGLDSIEFQFAPNPGEPARRLRAIASSGEMARVMLAIKTALAAEDAIPVLVFDEVDANVGGETAHAVGAKMRQIARQHQVLCITHLAPVAAQANTHFVVGKEVKNGRTISEITLLDAAGRIDELTRMLGGQSDAARQHAKALLAAK